MSWNMFNKSAKGHTSSIIYLFSVPFALYYGVRVPSKSTSKKRAGNLIISIFSSLFIFIYPFAAHIEEAKWDSNFSALYLLFRTERRSSNYVGTQKRAEISTSVTGFHNFALFCFLPMLLLNVNTQQNACPFSSPLHIISDMLIHKYYSLIRLTLYSELSSPSFAWLAGCLIHISE